MDRATLQEYFRVNPREWAKVAPIESGTVELITKLADNNAFSDARFLDFKSRKDAREQVAEADCMKSVLILFRSDAEFERRKKIIDATRDRIAAGPDALTRGEGYAG